jgi:hypothetical protein
MLTSCRTGRKGQGTDKKHTGKQVIDIHILSIEYITHKSGYLRVLFSSNKGVIDFQRWSKNADPMKADGDEADRGGPQGLLKRGRGPTGSRAFLNISGKSLLSVEPDTPPV